MTAADDRVLVQYMDRVREDPVYFLRELLGCKPWSKQIEIIEAVRDRSKVAVRSAHGSGKDWIAARTILWFLFAHAPVRVVSTAPTDRQVAGILWKEIAVAHKNALIPLGGRLLTQELHISEDRFGLGFTTASKTEGEAGSRFQGWHAPSILIVVDEASGVALEIYAEISGLLSSANAHLLLIGNPTNPTGEFADSFKDSDFQKFKISAFDTPNFTAFGITQEDIENDTWKEKITGPLPYPALVTPEWVADRYRKWGKESPLYQARVLAEFPTGGTDTLFPLDWLTRAQEATHVIPAPNDTILSADVARFGGDRTVVMERRGGVLKTIGRYSKQDTMTTTGYIIEAFRKTRARVVVVDVIGVGAGCVDRLREQHIPVIGFNGGSAPRDKERFLNKRAECYWRLREALEKNELCLAECHEDLIAQLSALKWKPDSQGKGRIQIESKDDMRRRGIPSPDDADCASQLFATSASSLSGPLIITPAMAHAKEQIEIEEDPRKRLEAKYAPRSRFGSRTFRTRW